MRRKLFKQKIRAMIFGIGFKQITAFRKETSLQTPSFLFKKKKFYFYACFRSNGLCNRDEKLYILKKISYTAIVGILLLNFIRFLKDLFTSVTCCYFVMEEKLQVI